MKETIGIDLDDVVSSQIDALIIYSNDRFGTSLTRQDFMQPGEYWGYYEKVWNVGAEEGSARFRQFLQDKGPLTQVISDESRTALMALKSKFNLDIITSRGGDYHQDTVASLSDDLPDVFSNVHFVELWSSRSDKVTKAMICQEIGAGYLIDDNVEHCRLAAEAGVKALLFGEYGWNKHLPTPPGVERVKDWKDVTDYFNVT